MIRRLVALLAVAGLAVGTAGPAAPSAVSYSPSKVNLSLQQITSGLSKPVLITHAGDGSNRLFIVEQTGKVKVRKNGANLATPLIDIGSVISHGYEQGLLGLAFHPSHETNRKFYVSFTNTSGDTIVNEYKTKASNHDQVDWSTARRIFFYNQPYENHNGGHIAFGPDGYLYLGLGDGGRGGDPGNRAQRTDTLLGKMIRIAPTTSGDPRYTIPSTNPYVGKAGMDEIWSRGLRNPWRWSFDRLTGTMWIGDVGQDRYEEVDRAYKTSAGGAGRGVNWGWKVYEGRHCFSPSSGCSLTGDQLPVGEYLQSGDRCAVTGGYVYRGSTYPDLYGTYLWADYCSGEIWAMDADSPSPAVPIRELDTTLKISSFGEDENGALYVVDLGGRIYRIRDS